MAEHQHDRITRPVAYVPKWEGPFEAYARKFAASNHWRVRYMWPDYEDVVSECKVIFARCLRSYSTRTTNGAWFMALFKTALANDFNTFARRSAQQAQGMREYAEQQRARGSEIYHYSEGPLAAAVSQASPELQKVLHLLSTSAPSTLLDMLVPDNPETTTGPALSRRWCRLARSKNLREDLILELHDLLK